MLEYIVLANSAFPVEVVMPAHTQSAYLQGQCQAETPH
jgi:hypothetical protein